MDRWRFPIVLLLAAGCAACGQPRRPGPASPAGRLQYAHLPGLRATPHRGLQAELTLIEQEQGLPLTISPPSSKEDVNRQSLAPATLIGQAFPPISRGLVQSQLEQVYRGGPLALSPIQLERGRELLTSYAAAREAFRIALPRAGEGFGPRMADGVLAELEFLEPLTIGCRLEGVAVSVALADNRPEEAVAHLETPLQVARLLAAEPNLTTRIAAANVRAEGLHALGAIATHPAATRATHERLFALLTAATTDWPEDARVWLGDRAGGLIVYELVRDGQYLALITSDEAQALQERQMLRVTARAVMRNLDEDELFYLRSLRQLIDACRLPYAQRVPVLKQIRGELTARAAAADYPLVAGNLLLTDFELGQRRQAEDLARCQAWTLALGTALDRRAATVPANPLTGEAYRIVRTPLAVRVANILPDTDEPIDIPVLPERQARKLPD